MKAAKLTLILILTVGIAFFALPSYAAEADNGIALEPQAGPARTAPVPVDGLWQEFGFSAVGVPATGCAPADPAGPGCVPSSGGNSEFAGPPPWTFDGPATLIIVTDAFALGDQFEVFDFGSPIGVTSPPGSGNCGDDPVPCLADPNASSGTFNLGPGPHSIDIVPVALFGPGAAYFKVESTGGPGPGEADLFTHYLCWKIRDPQPYNRILEVETQFGVTVINIGKERFFCAPAVKRVIE